MNSKKGFGGFVIASLLLSAAILAHIASSKKADDGFASVIADEHAMGRLAILKNSIRKSYEKLDGNDANAWRLEVQYQLAREYDLDILIDGNKVTLIDNEHAARSEFYLR